MIDSKASLVWLNGHVVPASHARIDPSDRGFLLGDGLFETMRLVGGEVPLLQRHLDRLQEGASILLMSLPERDVFSAAVKALVHASAILDGSMRLTVTRGCGPRGLLPPKEPKLTLLLTINAGAQPVVGVPIRLGISRYVRDGTSILSRIKTLNYLPGILSRMEAVKNGFSDALLPGSYETVAEASSSTFLALLDDELVTPPIFDGALPGISRGRLLEMGLCKERSIALNTLQRVRSAWLVTALGLTPVAGIEENLLFHDVSRTETIADALFRS
mgnify:FL=1